MGVIQKLMAALLPAKYGTYSKDVCVKSQGPRGRQAGSHYGTVASEHRRANRQNR